MSDRTKREKARLEEAWGVALRSERVQWEIEHAGDGYPGPDSAALMSWRRDKARAADKAMREAWLLEHPGEEALPEHLCALDHPYPGFKRWAAKARRWL